MALEADTRNLRGVMPNSPPNSLNLMTFAGGSHAGLRKTHDDDAGSDKRLEFAKVEFPAFPPLVLRCSSGRPVRENDSPFLGKRKLLLAYQGCERGVATFYDLPGIPALRREEVR